LSTDVPGTSVKWVERLSAYLPKGSLFYSTGVNKDGSENTTVLGTPFIKIDKNFDVEVGADEAGSSYSPLNWYDKDLKFISNSATGTAGTKTITILKANIPATAIYLRSSSTLVRVDLSYVKNGEITHNRLSSWNTPRSTNVDASILAVQNNVTSGLATKLDFLELFYSTGVNKDGSENTTVLGTPFVKIDKNFDVEVNASEAGSSYSPLNWYDKDLKFISNAATGTAGTKLIVVPIASIPATAIYLRSSKASAGLGGIYVKNGIITYSRLADPLAVRDKNNETAITAAANSVTALKDITPIVEELFFINTSLNKKGGVPTSNAGYWSTPFVKIDKNFDIDFAGYATASTTSGKLNALNYYNEKLEYIGFADNTTVTPNDTTGIKSGIIPKANIPALAVFMRAGYSIPNSTDHRLINGKITFDRLISSYGKRDVASTLITLNSEDFVNGTVYGNSGLLTYTDDTITSKSFLRIEKASDFISIITSRTDTSVWNKTSAFYDANKVFISEGPYYGLFENTGVPLNAVYFKVSMLLKNASNVILKINNTSLNDNEIQVTANYSMSLELAKTAVKDIKTKELMAMKYDNNVAKREMYLRQRFLHSGDAEKWYGSQWTEESNSQNVTSINSTGDSVLHTSLPIQSKIKRCIVKDGVFQYYLDANNSNLKEDLTTAKLDGTDGNVMVEIPEFFFKFETVDNAGVANVKLKISEQGINGFNYSPKQYTGAYHATLDRTDNHLVSVCNTLFQTQTENVSIESEDKYIVGSAFNLGTQKTVYRTGFTANAAKYRGGKNVSAYDGYTDNTNNNFSLNQLGTAVSQVRRGEARTWQRAQFGELMYQYDTHKTLWMLSIVEFKTRNIQDPIASGGLGKGATVYPDYEAYEKYFDPRGIASIPNGVTNSLGNNSGEIYFKMSKVPVEHTGSEGSLVLTRFADVWMPCVSYRGIENFYGHVYSVADQLTVLTKDTGTFDTSISPTAKIADVSYWYVRNPFKANSECKADDFIGKYRFSPEVLSISKILMGYDGHVLPIGSVASYLNGYAECTELADRGYPTAVSFNGRIVSGTLVGRNFIVGMYNDYEFPRGSECTRITQYIL